MKLKWTRFFICYLQHIQCKYKWYLKLKKYVISYSKIWKSYAFYFLALFGNHIWFDENPPRGKIASSCGGCEMHYSVLQIFFRISFNYFLNCWLIYFFFLLNFNHRYCMHNSTFNSINYHHHRPHIFGLEQGLKKKSLLSKKIWQNSNHLGQHVCG